MTCSIHQIPMRSMGHSRRFEASNVEAQTVACIGKAEKT